MLNYDIQKHNEQLKRLLELENRGEQTRVHMSIGANPRMIISDPKLNIEKTTFQQYFENPETMIDIQCRFQEYSSNNIVCDRFMGFENSKGISLYADFQNVMEPAYYGGDIAYHGTNEPGTRVLLDEKSRYSFLDLPFPSIYSGIIGKSLEYYEFFKRKQESGYTYKGKPILNVWTSGIGTDGIFTNACSLLGATEACIMRYEDECFAKEFLTYINESTIYRIKEMRKYFGEPEMSKAVGFADDSIALLSIEEYKKFILPYHKRYIDALSTGEEPNSIHLCGDATRLFKTINEQLNVMSFDTGFPVKHGEIIKELGADVAIYGGVHAEMLLNGSEEEIAKETRRILEEVKPLTHKFIIKEANNLAPRTPPKNLVAMYEAVKEFGNY